MAAAVCWFSDQAECDESVTCPDSGLLFHITKLVRIICMNPAHIEYTVDYFPAHILIMHALWILVKVSLVWVLLSRNLL